MARSLLLAEPLNGDFVVATAHFESMAPFAGKRRDQMHEAFKIIKQSSIENAIIVGDYNFDSKM